MGFSMKSLNVNKVLSNNNTTNFVVVLTLALSVGYLTNKHYEALICLYVVAIGAYLLCKNLLCSLAISIVLTNLLLSIDYLKVTESFKERLNPKDPKSKNNKKDNQDKLTKLKHNIPDMRGALKSKVA